MSPRKRAAQHSSGRDGEPDAEEAGGAPKAKRTATAAKELSSSCLPDEPRSPPPQDSPAPGRRRSFIPAALAAACENAVGDVPEEPGWVVSSMSELLPPPILWQCSRLPGDDCDDDRTKPPDTGARLSRESTSGNRCSGGGDPSAAPDRALQPSSQAAASTEQAPPVEPGPPTTLTADCLHMPRVVAGTRRSTFGCGRVSLRLAEPPCGVAGSTEPESHLDTSTTLTLEAKLKAHSRACMQEAIRRLNDSLPAGLEGMQQLLVEACEASDRAIDSAAGDEFVSQSIVDRTASFQTSRSTDLNHRLNLRLGRECRQWDSLVQSYRANADRAQSELSASTTRAAAAGTCTPAVVLAADSVRDNESTVKELAAAVETSRVQALIAGQRLTRAVAAARRFNVVAAARAAEEAEQLAAAAIPDTPRQPLSRVLGRR